jgi:beta-glucuronidase
MILRVVRRLAVCLCAVAACAATPARADDAGAGAGAGAVPRAIDLDSAGWEYAPDGATWSAVDLPHVFDARPEAKDFGGRTGVYRIALQQPDGTPRGYQWGIHFEQVRRVAEVLLDGRRLVTHRDPYAPFTVPLPQLGDGARHELTVRVDNHKAKEPREGWWNWGGITRPAQLVPLGALTTQDAGFIPQQADDGSWSVLVDATVTNRGAATVAAQLRARLTNPDGDAAGEARATSRPLAPGERARVRFRVPVAGDARLWGPGHPALYGAALDTSAGGTTWDHDSAKIGLRTVKVVDGLLELNGRPVELRGASIQEDVDGHGPALTDADVRSIVAQLKGIGANVTRAHYALDQRLQSALDAAGIMVWTQAPIYHRDQLLKTEEQREAALSTVRAAVLQTRDHPSTITHSVANELSVIPDEVPGTKAFLDAAREQTLDLDPALPTSVDTLSYPGYPRQETYAKFQLLGVNSYFGWYPGKPGHRTADIRDLGPYLDGMRAMYPNSGLVLTEFGAEATLTGPSTDKQTYAFQEVYTRDVLGAVRAAPTLSGAIYWTLQEFAVKPAWDGGAGIPGADRNAIHHKGLITYDGRRKPAYDVLKRDIADTPLVRSDADVAYALDTRVPVSHRGRVGLTVAVLILLAATALLALDVWAFFGWRAAILADDRDTRAARRRHAIRVRAAARQPNPETAADAREPLGSVV